MPSAPIRRADSLAALADQPARDLIIIGGGATGLGIAVDAAARGLTVALLEARDFAEGTSSRSTKLVHGGVRYLAQGNIGLVREALHERATLLANAGHIAAPLPFLMPAYRAWERPWYGSGLKVYDWLAGRAGIGHTASVGRDETLRLMPNLQPQGLRGAVRYWDGQFDDARLAIALARTAHALGATVVNHCPVVRLLHDGPRIAGVVGRDAETGREFALAARCVVNATGVWVDAIREQDAVARGGQARPIVAPSQGVHLVVDRDFLASDHALLVPKTRDGRVLFAVPWLGKVVLGTTDTPRSDLPVEPTPRSDEIDFILGESARYLVRAPRVTDVRSVWVGLRPLVRPDDAGEGGSTSRLSREHTVLVASSGLVTVTGGKWTTYRAMAADVLDHCQSAGLLGPLPACTTATLRLLGAPGHAASALHRPFGLHRYGTEAALVESLPGATEQLDDAFSVAMVRFAARYEMARTVHDVLARRSRLLFLDAARAEGIAEAVAAILRAETGADPKLAEFRAVAKLFGALSEPDRDSPARS